MAKTKYRCIREYLRNGKLAEVDRGRELPLLVSGIRHMLLSLSRLRSMLALIFDDEIHGVGMMSLIPAFELGFWNAWILMLYLLSHSAIVRLIDNRVWEKMQPIAGRRLSKTEKRILYLSRAIRLFLLVYSFFLLLRLGTVWCYAGIPICVIGSATWTVAWVNFATTLLDQPVTKGLYRYSRHPMFLTAFLVGLGVSVASASWLYLLLTVVGMVLRFFLYAIPEESFCLAKYGDAYREYLNRTPRWIGIPKSKKSN